MGTMLNPCLSSSSSPRGLHTQTPLFSHPFQSLSSRSSLSTLFKSSSLPAQKPLQWRKLSLECRHSDYFEPHQQQNQWASPNNSSFSSQPGTLPPKVFIGYSIYKGKAALTVVPCAPEFSPLDSGAFKLSKEGFVLLQFAPAAGVRQYDWGRKQVFSLSVTELGSLISLGAKDSCEFFHDPNKGKSDEGKVRKVLKIEPLPDGSGHFFNLSVQNKLINVDENIYIPVSKAEFAVLVSAFNFVLPYLLGWHTFVSSVGPEDANYANNATNPRSGADFEWRR
ncbi:PREDICTED: single-stranded DNA-binding protein WHY1, chloroplastic-like isoform X2 [Ipomoea nil]|uniref:single-stranded DNA-binding protein WHY1, chloroplastic-like isoform X2 n=1 Tax=Ipomoea nil TaxID=35883 RepID=UPI000900A34F|nr:PREDICTED: single-stranded DNA-binding protein WHY1, chloroplastic-like isoform X2 [Ipomoea nil]